MANLQLDPLDQQLAANLRGDFAEGWRLSQLLEKERPGDKRAIFNRGWHMMRLGDLRAGMQCFEAGREIHVFGSTAPSEEISRWTGAEDIADKTVLLRSEGGLGDEIINVRFATLIAQRGARVVVSCHPSLVSIFKRVEGVADAVPHAAIATLQYDFWVPAMSAALPLGLTFDTLPHMPYLTPEPAALRAWNSIINQNKKGGALRVGIRWSGNPRFEHEQHRRFPAEPILALSEFAGASLYSLQRDDDLRDLPNNITDLQSLLVTWEDTTAAIANLDLVITSCTAIAHLASALGKETWVIVPVLPYYIWARPGDTSPWYKTVRLFRQEMFDNWDAPLEKVRIALGERIGLSVPFSGKNSAVVVPQQKKIVVPGLFIAPEPVSHTPRPLYTVKRTIHFVAGLPRAGSTALMSVLAQNPSFYAAPLSGLCGIFAGIYANWDKGESHIELPNPEAKRRVLRALLENYHETDRPIIFDKNRQWVMYSALLEEILERPIKIIVPVRPLPEVLASFEALRRKSPIALTMVDESIGEGTTIAGRAAYYAGPSGALGMAYNAMKDAVTAGYLDRMLFVDYNNLMNAPKMQLKRIYEFLGEVPFEHNLGNVKQIAHGDSWRAQKLPGLHDVRPEFKKEPKSAREILGNDVFAQYDQGEPWASWT